MTLQELKVESLMFAVKILGASTKQNGPVNKDIQIHFTTSLTYFVFLSVQTQRVTNFYIIKIQKQL